MNGFTLWFQNPEMLWLALLPPAGDKGALAHKELPPAEPIAGADEGVAVYELVREAAK